MKPKKTDDMIQIDHMSVTKNQVTVKYFQAWDPITKTIPFAVRSIQIDGGSEFMQHFEEECKEKKYLYIFHLQKDHNIMVG